jgi:hypothetical protein
VPTRVHIPVTLLEAVDQKARRLGVSRNRFIVQALQREVALDATWSPGFFQRLAAVTPEDAAEVDALLRAVRAGCRSKGTPRL